MFMVAKKDKKFEKFLLNIWSSKLGVQKILDATIEVLRTVDIKKRKDIYLKDLVYAIDKEICRSDDSKSGYFEEDMVAALVADNPRFEVFSGAYKGGVRKQETVPLDYPIGLDSIVYKIFLEVEQRNISLTDSKQSYNFFKSLYDAAYNYECSNNEEFFERKANFDLRFKDLETNEVYLYEVKKKGSFGNDVRGHKLRLIRAYVSYIYNYKPEFSKVHTNFLLVEREECDKWSYFSRGEFGYILFSDFCSIHNLEFDTDWRDDVIAKKKRITYKKLKEVLKNVLKLLDSEKTSGLLGYSVKNIYKTYENVYSVKIS